MIFSRLFAVALPVLSLFIFFAESQKGVFSQAAVWIDGVTQYPTAHQSESFPVLKYTVVEGFFKQSDERTNDRTYDPVNILCLPQSRDFLLSGNSSPCCSTLNIFRQIF